MSVPEQFVGVERRITVTSLAVHVDVGREVGTPWEGNSGVGTILVIPRGEIVGGLQTVVRVCIGGVVVGRDVEPTVPETERNLWGEVVTMGDVAVGDGCAVDVDVRHLMAVVATERPTEVPAVESVEGNIERGTAVGIPVAVDVLGTADATARFLVVCHHIADGVVRSLETTVDVVAPVPLTDGDAHAKGVGTVFRRPLFLEVGIQVVRERGL